MALIGIGRSHPSPTFARVRVVRQLLRHFWGVTSSRKTTRQYMGPRELLRAVANKRLEIY